MPCSNVHATTLTAFFCGMASVVGLFVATILPRWRQMRLYTLNKNEKNLTIYEGLWVKCIRYDDKADCIVYDAQWYQNVDQLDIRVLQFALPISIFIALAALLLCLIGLCNTAYGSDVPNINLTKCLINSAGCHLVAGTLYLLAGVICIVPSIGVFFYNRHLNKKYEPIFKFDIAVYIAIGSAAGLFFTSLLLFLWYCACKKLPSPLWQPLYSQAPSVRSYPYGSAPYSARSRMSTIEIDIPLVTEFS
uniref:Claudin 12 n=1 Tax=Latimeria chalumnae TaxID=7897 RepID=H3B3S5_LATCH